jgi:hypothetical protein
MRKYNVAGGNMLFNWSLPMPLKLAKMKYTYMQAFHCSLYNEWETIFIVVATEIDKRTLYNSTGQVKVKYY